MAAGVPKAGISHLPLSGRRHPVGSAAAAWRAKLVCGLAASVEGALKVLGLRLAQDGPATALGLGCWPAAPGWRPLQPQAQSMGPVRFESAGHRLRWLGLQAARCAFAPQSLSAAQCCS